MKDNDTNEPAYPSFQVRRVDKLERIDVLHPGLTKREVFAAMAMQGWRAGGEFGSSADAARFAVNDADALLKELAK